jgi:hypothetical protein
MGSRWNAGNLKARRFGSNRSKCPPNVEHENTSPNGLGRLDSTSPINQKRMLAPLPLLVDPESTIKFDDVPLSLPDALRKNRHDVFLPLTARKSNLERTEMIHVSPGPSSVRTEPESEQSRNPDTKHATVTSVSSALNSISACITQDKTRGKGNLGGSHQRRTQLQLFDLRLLREPGYQDPAGYHGKLYKN